MSLSVLTNPATEVATGKISKWIAANNPILFTAVRKDHEFDSVSNTSGKLNIIFNGVDKTADFLANDKIYVKSDDGTYNEAGTVTSSSFSTNTTVATSIDYTSSSGGGYANNNTQRANYVVEVDIKKISDDTSLLTNKPQLETFTDGTINITLGSYISSEVSADHGFDFSTSTAIDSNGVFHFYCTFLEVWDSSSETAVTAIHSTQKLSNNEFTTDLSDWTNSGSGTAWAWDSQDSGSAKVDTTPAGNTQYLMQNEELFKGLAYRIDFEIGEIAGGTPTLDIVGRLASDSSTLENITADIDISTEDVVITSTFVASKNYDQIGFRVTTVSAPDVLTVGVKYYNLYDAVTLSAVMSTKQIGETYGQNLGEYVPWSDGSPNALILTKFTNPKLDNDFPFELPFLYDNDLYPEKIYFREITKDESGASVETFYESIDNSNQGKLLHVQSRGNYLSSIKENDMSFWASPGEPILVAEERQATFNIDNLTDEKGQTFTTGIFLITHLIVDFVLDPSVGSPNGTIRATVESTTAGLPDGVTQYGTVVFTPKADARNTILIPMSPSLTSSTQYAIYFKGESGNMDASNRYVFTSDTPSSYAGGTYVQDVGSGWVTISAFDVQMSIWQATSIVQITETKTVKVADPCQDKFTLLWRNSLGGFSQWTFTDTQEVTFTEEDRSKFKDFLTSATNVTVNQLEALDEMQRPGDIVKEGFFLLASQTRTHKKIGQAIYELSTSGGKTGVIILNEPTTYKTSDTNADFQILVRKPEIL